MPRKYLRMTRRCTCVTPDLEEEENEIAAAALTEPLLILLHKKQLWERPHSCE